MAPIARRRKVSPAVLSAVVAGVTLWHGLVLVLLQVVGVNMIGDGFSVGSAQAATQPEPESELDTSCSGNVLLATMGRAAMCMAPWRGNVAGCGDDLEMAMWMDLSGCRARTDDIVSAIALAPPQQTEKLPQIDPEQLLNELKQLEQPPPPPPPVQQQVAQAPPPPPPPAPPPQRPQQVVETVKPNDEKEPDNARFLSEYNVKVDKQTVSRGARNEPMVAKAKPEELTPKKDTTEDPSIKEQPPDKPPGTNEKAPEVPGKLAMRKPGAVQPAEAPQDAKTRGAQTTKDGPIVADGFVPRKGDGAIEQQRRDPGEQTQGQAGAGGGAPPMPNLKPSKEQLERALGGGSVDHLEEVENGEETALSAKKWVYADFFNRLKRQVAQNWDPGAVWRRSDPNGTHYGTKTRVTEVRVVLSAKGDLSKVVVSSPSGANELDDEALRAFHTAAPFPNPPEGLVRDNKIEFAFSFIFEIGHSRTSWRLLRPL